MRNLKKIFTVILVAALAAALAVVNASAAEPPVADITQSGNGSIRINMTYQGNPVPGGAFSLYQIADVQVNNGYHFVYRPEYSGFDQASYPLDSSTALSDEAVTRAMATALNSYISAGVITPLAENVAADAYGRVSFGSLPFGLYLVKQTTAANGFYPITPFLVTVPFLTMENGEWVWKYAVDASPKTITELIPVPPPSTDDEPEPTPTPTPPPPGGGFLPQTGQLNWPVPLLAVAGLVLFALGWWMNRRQEQ